MNPLVIGLIITCCIVMLIFVKKGDDLITVFKKVACGVLIFFALFAIYIFVVLGSISVNAMQ
jgi:hypothetical protein